MILFHKQVWIVDTGIVCAEMDPGRYFYLQLKCFETPKFTIQILVCELLYVQKCTHVLIWQADTIRTKQRWDNTKWVFNEVFSQSWQFDGILYKYEIKVWTLDKKSSKLWTVIQQRAANLPFQKASYGTTSNPSTSCHKTLRNDAIIHCSHGHFLPPVVYFLVSTFW